MSRMVALVMLAATGLAAVFVPPAWHRHTLHERLREGVAQARTVQVAVEQFHQRRAALPADNRAAGLPAPDAFQSTVLAGIEVRGGVVTLRYWDGSAAGSAAEPLTLTLRPAIDRTRPGAPLAWVCQEATTPAGHERMGALSPRPLPADQVQVACAP
jgi:hypothetical protein